MNRYAVIIAVLAVSATGCRNPERTMAVADTVSDEEAAVQETAYSQYERLSEILNYNDSTGKSDMPWWYGGFYIDRSDRAVTLLTDMAMADSLKALGMTQTDFLPCDYSFATLKQTVDSLNAAITSPGSWASDNITMVYINTQHNRVEASLARLTADTERAFRLNVTSSPAVVLSQGQAEVRSD